MKLILIQWLINALAIIVAVKFVDGIRFSGPWWYMLIIGSLFGIVNSIIKPVIRLFTYPIIILTFGIFALVINAAMLGLTSFISGQLELGFTIEGFWPALWGALVVSIISMLLSWVTGYRRQKERSEGEENAQ
jgi:putative membrane protein